VSGALSPSTWSLNRQIPARRLALS
jgi:hypothetical protein